ncbi:hypothetical protein LLG90_06345 [Aromatoleum toluclasticum]|uniref:hypothetical protein n=1 Tax=Aromatoleum toluclasticum TaxID=92003 RepID=UPI001D191BA8|nr:hypothetical protein [Aromatoleum toluclasticum]MCC4114967.1 hypothetical protein [Aromatoleum toluclasticum]
MIFPAADRPGWFRFHGLFSDYLRRESRATRSEAERHAVLGRAVQWCRKHGEYRDAFELALTIRDGAQASDILAGRAQCVVRDEGRHLFYINAYERLLEIEPFPADEAQYWCVWAMLFARQYEKAYRVLAAMRLGTKSDDPVADRMPGRKQALLSIILFSLDRVPEAQMRGERWLESDDGLDPFESSGVACVVGTSAVADLDFPAVRRAIMLARNSMSRTGSEYALGWMSCLDALIDIQEGDLAFVHDTRIAWLIAQRDFQAALAATDIELHSALKSPCATWQVHLLLTRLQIEAATGHAAQASKTLLRAIGIAAPRRLLQPFIEHGDVIQPLIMADPKKNWPLVNDKEFVFFADLRQRLGSALAPDRSSPRQEAAADSFELDAPTSREIELQGFLDNGLSNQEIASASRWAP